MNLFEFLDLREYLENRLKTKVDIVMVTALSQPSANTSWLRLNMSKGQDDYMGVDLKTVWTVVQMRLPELKPTIEEFISSRKD